MLWVVKLYTLFLILDSLLPSRHTNLSKMTLPLCLQIEKNDSTIFVR